MQYIGHDYFKPRNVWQPNEFEGIDTFGSRLEKAKIVNLICPFQKADSSYTARELSR